MPKYELNQNIIRLSSDDKKKKNGGINAVLALMRETLEFQEKVDLCMEEQQLEPNRQKIAEFDAMLDTMYDALLGIASGGVQSVRERTRQEKPVSDRVLNGPVIHSLPR